MKAPGKNCTPANADSLFENRHFLTHRPPIISRCSPLTMRTCSPLTMRRPPPIGSPHRGILCVEKIGSAAPELQEWPGAPSKPVKWTIGRFYWLTRRTRSFLQLWRHGSDFPYTKNSAMGRSDCIYTKNSARPRSDFLYTKNFIRKIMKHQWYIWKIPSLRALIC